MSEPTEFRCPSCGYVTGAVAGYTCPECGEHNRLAYRSRFLRRCRVIGRVGWVCAVVIGFPGLLTASFACALLSVQQKSLLFSWILLSAVLGAPGYVALWWAWRRGVRAIEECRVFPPRRGMLAVTCAAVPWVVALGMIWAWVYIAFVV